MGTKTRRILLEDIKALFKFVVKVIILSDEIVEKQGGLWYDCTIKS